MFEKEAEKKYCNGCKWRIEQCLWAWRKTNGLKEPNEKNCSCKEVPAYLAGAEFGYNKANEWHKVANEGLPINKNDGKTYLLYTIYGEGGSPVVAHFAYRDKQQLLNIWTGAILTEDKIIAWKEIVLPKESE